VKCRQRPRSHLGGTMMLVDPAESGLDVIRLLFHADHNALRIRIWIDRVATIFHFSGRRACVIIRQLKFQINRVDPDDNIPLDYFFMTSTMRQESRSESTALLRYPILLSGGSMCVIPNGSRKWNIFSINWIQTITSYITLDQLFKPNTMPWVSYPGSIGWCLCWR